MVRRMVAECDLADGICLGIVKGYRLWAEGDRQACSVDLCEAHARPLVAVFERGELVDLPVKPRVRMEGTKLRPTERTAHLKKPKE